jgi:phenol hydroxylase P0 protein
MTDWGDASVRVTGIRRSRFVEFEFSLGEELVVELVMPYREFQTFCEEHHARVLPADGESALELMQLADTASAGRSGTTEGTT